jgi:hypothetical protein
MKSQTYYPDLDNDGYGDLYSVSVPSGCTSCVPNNLDCNDASATQVICLNLPPVMYTSPGAYDIFFKNLILSTPDSFDFVVNGTTLPGSALKYTGNGSGTLNISVKKGANTLASGVMQVIATAMAAPASASPKVIPMGHSFVASFWELFQLTPMTPGLSYRGSQSSFGVPCEGYPGRGWLEFATQAPFAPSGTVNMANYFQNVCVNCAGTPPEYIFIQLVVNDFLFNPNINTYAAIDAEITSVWSTYAIPLLNAIHTATPNTKIGISITPAKASPALPWARKTQYRIASLIHSQLGTLPGVFVFPTNLEINPDTDFEDSVHPNQAGYSKLNRNIAGWLAYQVAQTPVLTGDQDNDGILDAADNCPTVANPTQANFDNDAQGDACDPDDDNDGILDINDSCPFGVNPILGKIDIVDQSGIANDLKVCHLNALQFGTSGNAGGTGAFSYVWSTTPAMAVTNATPNGSFVNVDFVNPSNNNLPVSVQVILTDAAGCKDTTTVGVTAFPELDFNIQKIDNSGVLPNDGVVCFGDSVTLQIANLPAGTHTYSWSNTIVASSTKVAPPYTNTNQNYSVSVTNSAGCTASQVAGVTGIGQITSTLTFKPACNPADPDSMVFNATGGNAPYNLFLNGGILGFQQLPYTFPTFQPVGTPITVTAIDQQGCSPNSVTVNLPAGPTSVIVAGTTTAATCSQGGSITTITSGGLGSYTYLWSNGANTANLSNVPAGTYTVTATDGIGCTDTDTFVIEPAASIVLAPINVINNSGGTGNQICHAGNVVFGAQVVTGSGPYSYQWSATGNPTFVGNQTTGEVVGANFSNNTNSPVNAAITVTVTDVQGCSASQNATIVVTPELDFTVAKLENSGTPNDGVVCFGQSVNLQVSNLPTGTFSYLWSTNATTQQITATPLYNNQNQNYSVTVTNAAGCSAALTSGITGIGQITATLTYKPSCSVSEPDTLIYNATGGLSPYNLQINGSSFGFQNLPVKFPTFAAAGTGITVTSVEQNGCSPAPTTLVLPVHPPDLQVIGTITPVNCNVLGSITTSVSGGVAPYTYQWANGGGTQANRNNLTAGTYTVTVTGANGCTKAQSFTVGQIGGGLTVAPINVQNNSGGSGLQVCHTGNVTFGALATSGTAPYTYQWTSTGNPVFVNNQTNTQTIGINYTNTSNAAINATVTVVVADANGCSASQNATITVTPELDFTVAKLENSGTPNDGVVCFGQSINLQVNNLPTGTFSYLWNTNATTSQITATPLYNNQNQNYNVTVTNAAGCSAALTSGITGVTAISSSITAVLSCNLANPDSIRLSASGGQQPYLMEINGGIFGFQPSPITVPTFQAPGTTITYVVTDQNGCSAPSASLTVPARHTPLQITSSVTPLTCTLAGAIATSVSGGITPYTYLWSTGTTTANLTNLTAGSYTITLTDAIGCTGTQAFTVGTQTTSTIWYRDLDNDGFGSTSTLAACTQPAGYVAVGGDCNDNNPAVKPGATELCNGVDDNCNGTIDEGVTAIIWYRDLDNDGFGSTSTLTACTQPAGYVAVGGDCNDNNPAVKPGATELCNGVDDNCNETIDEGAVSVTWYRDIDNDGYGDPLDSIRACIKPNGYVALSGDCCDTNASIKPGAPEVCNGIDDDCDGSIDESLTLTTYYRDSDLDGFGNASHFKLACGPSGLFTATNSLDCHDNNFNIKPTATEICNGIDDNCNGQIDEGFTPTVWYKDNDNDGYGIATNTKIACAKPSGFVALSGDCNDNNPNIKPNATEICNGIDDNCNGTIDEGLAITKYFKDLDSDNFGQTNDFIMRCAPQGSYKALVGGDCNDLNPALKPGATELCNGIDDNCNGQIDENAGFNVTVTPVHVTCNGGSNGSISTTISGITGTCLYQWNNGCLTKNQWNLPAGNYTVTVTHLATNCQKVVSVTVNQPTPIQATLTSTQTATSPNPLYSITVAASGGTPFVNSTPYRFRYKKNNGNWSGWSTNPMFSNLSVGNFTVEVIDAASCKKAFYIAIGSNNAPLVVQSGQGQANVFNPQNLPDQITLFPNPTQTYLNLYFKTVPKGTGICTITNALGIEMQQIPFDQLKADEVFTVQLDGYDPGVYFLNYQPEQSISVTKRFVIIEK